MRFGRLVGARPPGIITRDNVSVDVSAAAAVPLPPTGAAKTLPAPVPNGAGASV